MAVTRGGGDEGEGACPAPAPPPGPAPPPPGIEVPFLVSNNTKWISGIVEATSCGDIIKALLAAEGRLKGITEEQLERFVLVERWRRVERPLKKDSCLLKIWQAWGPEARDVQFILKRVSCKKVSRPRTKVKRTNSKLIKQLAELEQKHPKYAGSDSESEVVNMQGNIQVRDTHTTVYTNAVKRSIGFTITEKAPTRTFSSLKAPTSAFTFKTLLRHYAKRALTPR